MFVGLTMKFACKMTGTLWMQSSYNYLLSVKVQLLLSGIQALDVQLTVSHSNHASG